MHAVEHPRKSYFTHSISMCYFCESKSKVGAVFVNAHETFITILTCSVHHVQASFLKIRRVKKGTSNPRNSRLSSNKLRVKFVARAPNLTKETLLLDKIIVRSSMA